MTSRLARVLTALIAAFTFLAWPSSAQAPVQKLDPLGEDNLMAAMHTISSHTLLDYVKELASEKYQGRLTGTRGYEAAAQWALNMFADWKIKPAGDRGTYLQHFPDPYTLVLPGSELSLNVPITGGARVVRILILRDESEKNTWLRHPVDWLASC